MDSTVANHGEIAARADECVDAGTSARIAAPEPVAAPEKVAALGDEELVGATRELARRVCAVEADLLVYIAEVDARRLYLPFAYSTLFAFLTGELGFSEDAAYNRVAVARLGRRLPAALEALRRRRVHLTGLRLLAPLLTEENHAAVLERAEGRTKPEILELVASLAPKPDAPTVIRKLPTPSGRAAAPSGSAPETSGNASVPSGDASASSGSAAPSGSVHVPPAGDSLSFAPAPRAHSTRAPSPAVVPLAEDRYRLQVTTTRSFQDKLREARDLCRHELPSGDLARLLELALDALVREKKKAKFAVGRKPRSEAPTEVETDSRHVPAAIARAVYERDGGRCAFTDERGRRCTETGWLELDHIDGFAQTHVHDASRMRLLCRAHNQHTADLLYGRAFMDQSRSGTGSLPGPSG